MVVEPSFCARLKVSLFVLGELHHQGSADGGRSIGSTE
jgi:hypothetical protein